MNYAMQYHMRRMDKEITDRNVMKNLLKTAKYVTIALSMNNQPYLVTLSCGFDENRNCIYFHCAREGKKIDYLRANNVVWGQAIVDNGYVESKCEQLYTSVHFSGKVAFIDDLDEKTEAIQCMIRQLEKDPEPMIAKLNSERLKEALIGRIDIDFMSGKGPEKNSNPTS